MPNIVCLRACVLALVLSTAVGAQAPAPYSPPRIASAALPDVPPPNVIGGGEVLIEALIDRNGQVTRPVLLRSTPPFTQLVLDAISRWRFLPATSLNPKGSQETVEASVLIAALYRPPTLFNGPTAGERPKDVGAASADVAYPAALIAPPYPVKAVNVTFAAVLFEVQLDERGEIRGALPVVADPGFESAARDAVMQ